ncbi:MAG: TlpA family protein disulfide reductase [Candidatus Cryptobacteroides sp.]
MKLIDSIKMGLAAAAAFLLLAGCGDSKCNRAVDYPFYVTASFRVPETDIVRVECTDSAVSVTLLTKFIPGYWFRWSENTVIYADGKAYPAIGSDDIVLGEKKKVGESGECIYTMHFAPVPARTRTIDLSEGLEPGYFNIWGIDLTGKAKPKQNPVIPKPVYSDTLPGFDESIANSTIRVHMLGFRKPMSEDITLHISQVIKTEDLEAKVGEDDIVEFNFKQYGTASFECVWNYVSIGNGTIAPGETLDVYYDVASLGQEMMSSLRPDYRNPDIRYKGVSPGKYACAESWNPPVDIVLFSKDFIPDCRNIDADGYYDAMMSKYRDALAAADTLGLSSTELQLTQTALMQTLMTGMVNSNMLIQNTYLLQTGNMPDFNPIELDKRHFDVLLSEMDYSDPLLLTYCDTYGLSRCFWSLIASGFLTQGRPYEIGKSAMIAYEAQNRKFTEEERREIDGMEWSFLKTALYQFEKDSEQIRNSLTANYQTVEDWPGAKAWIDSVLAPHKGKVVMIDLWNTWCAPCRSSIALNEPYKNGELSSEDIVWIYIADESSNLAKYVEMIESIRGEHYLLTASQKKELSALLGVDGIPFYVLAERDGSYASRPDLRDHNKFVKELKDRIAD